MIDTVARRPWPSYVAKVSAVLMITLGAIVLLGWTVKSPALIQLSPTLPPMTRNAALCFGLCGVALMTLAIDGPRWAVFLCAGLVTFVSMTTIIEIVFRVDAGIDELLGSSFISVNLKSPGRMAPLTAVCFAFSSVALMLAPSTFTITSSLLVGLGGSIVTAFGAAAVVGYWGGVTLAALHTSFGLVILGVGMLALAWRVEAHPMPTPPWLPLSVVIGVLTGIVGLWRALVLGGYAPFSMLPTVVLVVGCVVGPIFGLTVFLAQRGHAQAAALRRSETFLEEAQHLSRTGSFSWNVSTDTVTFSAQAYRIYEFEAGPISFASIARMTHTDDMPLFLDMAGRARRGEDLDEEYRLHMGDQSVKHLHLVAHQCGANENFEYIGAIQDVTDRQLSEEALDQVRSELARVARMTSLGTLTASIAHEVNQPLAGIVTNAGTCLRMLASDSPNVEGARETAKRTIRDANRASEVIKRLRALFVKNAANNELVDLSEATREVTALLSNELQRSRVLLRTELADALPPVLGDRVQLQQVIMNLLMNASDAMVSVDDRPRQLVITTTRDDDNSVRLTVEDVGVGFQPDEANRLFEAFYTTKNRGMGIGLSVSRSIVERHNGRLWAVPNSGPGATFSFAIPHSVESSPGVGNCVLDRIAGRPNGQHAAGKL